MMKQVENAERIRTFAGNTCWFPLRFAHYIKIDESAFGTEGSEHFKKNGGKYRQLIFCWNQQEDTLE